MRKLFISVGLCACLAGCSVPVVLDSVTKGVEKSNAVVSELEKATDYAMPDKVAETGESVGHGISKGARIVAPIADTFFPGAGVIIGGIGALAGAIGTWFQNRKRRSAEAQRDAIMVAVDDISGIGAKIVPVAAMMGVAKELKDHYDNTMGK